MRPNLFRLIGTCCALAIPAGMLALPAAGPKQPRLDAYGDPLPPGATARFGSLRWRTWGSIMSVTLSPDNKRLAALGFDGRVTIWDMASGRKLHYLAGSQRGENCLAFSPDGRYLATGGTGDLDKLRGDCRVRVWEVRSGQERLRLPRQPSDIDAVAFTPDGAALVSGGMQQPVIVWAFPGGHKLREFRSRSEGDQPFALSPNGRWLAVREGFEEISLYSFERGLKLYTLRAGTSVDGFRFSADSRCLLTYGYNDLHFWEVATGKLRWRLADIKSEFRWSAYPAPDGRKVALVGIDGGIRWLDARTGKAAGSWTSPQPTARNALAFSPDGRTVVSGEGGAVRLWDAATGKVLRAPSGPGWGGCNALAFSPDGKTLVAGADNLYLLDGTTLRERGRVPAAVYPILQLIRTNLLNLSPDGTLASAVAAEGEILLLDMRLGKVVRTLRHRGWGAASAAFGPEGKKLYALPRQDGALRVWDVATGKEGAALCTDIVWPSSLAVAPAGGKLAVATRGPKPRCRLWDLRTGQELPGLKGGHDSLLFSRDNKLLASYSIEHLTVWDVAKRAALRHFDFTQKGVTAAAFSPDGRLLVTGHMDGSFCTWDLTDGKKRAEVRRHPGMIVALACSPDGEGLVSACNGSTVLRWEATAWKGK